MNIVVSFACKTVATRKLKMTHMTHVLFLLDGAALHLLSPVFLCALRVPLF